MKRSEDIDLGIVARDILREGKYGWWKVDEWPFRTSKGWDMVAIVSFNFNFFCSVCLKGSYDYVNGIQIFNFLVAHDGCLWIHISLRV